MNALQFALLAILGMGAATAAPIANLTITNSPQSGIPGSTLTYQGSITSLVGFDVPLDSLTFNISAPFSITDFDSTPFLTLWPLTLTAGSSFGPQDLFTVTIGPAVAPGVYTANVAILGASTLLADAAFQIDVTADSPIPEPGTLGLVALAIVAGIILKEYVRRKWCSTREGCPRSAGPPV